MPEATPERFRRAVSRYATGIAIVTTVADGTDHAMTANSFTSVSLDPLLALVCVDRGSRFHDAVLASGVWAVSFLPEGGEATARWFAKRGRPLAGQFAGHPTHRAVNGCVLLDHLLAGLELRTQQIVPAGDHAIVIGEVTAIHDPDASAAGTGVEPAAAPSAGAEPTIYFASRFRHLA
jgi:flavin reductase (DIM6/NTAB) family NADH-FMN oxidoreductase RutF